eukprot:235220_1
MTVVDPRIEDSEADRMWYEGEYVPNPDGSGKNMKYGKGKLTKEWFWKIPCKTVVYDGEWRNDIRHGQGTEEHYVINDEGAQVKMEKRYTGQWENDKQNGHGTQTVYKPSGDAFEIIEGEWKDGKLNKSAHYTKKLVSAGEITE